MSRDFDVVVVGAGIGGISAAVAAARAGARVALVDANEKLGGTGVHSALGILCGLGPRVDQWVNEGVLREFFPDFFARQRQPNMSLDYDAHVLADRYQAVVSKEPNITVLAATTLQGVTVDEGKSIKSIRLAGKNAGEVTGRVFVDGTADGNLSAMAGAEYKLGRDSDGKMQPSTLTFTIRNIDKDRLGLGDRTPAVIRNNDDKHLIGDALGINRAWQKVKQAGTTNPKAQNWVLYFMSPDGRSIVFNHTRVTDVDPTKPGDIERGRKVAEGQVMEMWNEMKNHPALQTATLEISPMLGVREGRRIVGDYVLTQEDALGEARFDDMVAACSYCIDIHDPTGAGTRVEEIPGSGYYHIPYRSLRAKGFTNLLLGSRCLSGTHEAHSSYRVMAPLSAVGQACGVAAALTAKSGKADVRDVSAAAIRHVLRQQGQFTEGAHDANGLA